MIRLIKTRAFPYSIYPERVHRSSFNYFNAVPNVPVDAIVPARWPIFHGHPEPQHWTLR